MTEQSGPSGRLHVQPHGAHMDKVAHAVADLEEDEHDYEALPVGYGWGTNMLAGAMVRIYLGVWPGLAGAASERAG